MSQADQKRIISLRRSGLSVTSIASFLGTDTATVADAVKGTGNLPAAGGGAGLSPGSWDALEEWVDDPADTTTARWTAITALTVPSEVIVFGYFDMSSNPGLNFATLWLHEGEFSTNMENLVGYAEAPEGIDSTFFLRAIIAANVVPILNTSGAAAEAGAAVVQAAKRRPLG